MPISTALRSVKQSTRLYGLYPYSHSIKIPTISRVWPCKGLRRVSVNSFGFGGTNTHIVMDDALHYLQERGLHGNHRTARSPVVPDAPANGHIVPPDRPHLNGGPVANGVNGANKIIGGSEINGDRWPNNTNGVSGVDGYGINGLDRVNGSKASSLEAYNILPQESPRLLIWSATDEKAVTRMRQQYDTFYRRCISGSSHELDKLAFTLASRRSKLLWRQFAVVTSEQLNLQSAVSKPVRSSGPDDANLAFVFTGQGAQYAYMGLGLLQYPVFRVTLEEVNKVYRSLGCEWSILGK